MKLGMLTDGNYGHPDQVGLELELGAEGCEKGASGTRSTKSVVFQPKGAGPFVFLPGGFLCFVCFPGGGSIVSFVAICPEGIEIGWDGLPQWCVRCDPEDHPIRWLELLTPLQIIEPNKGLTKEGSCEKNLFFGFHVYWQVGVCKLTLAFLWGRITRASPRSSTLATKATESAKLTRQLT